MISIRSLSTKIIFISIVLGFVISILSSQIIYHQGCGFLGGCSSLIGKVGGFPLAYYQADSSFFQEFNPINFILNSLLWCIPFLVVGFISNTLSNILTNNKKIFLSF